MDSFAIGLKVAKKLIDDKTLDKVIEERYASYTEGIGKDIVEGKTNFHELEKYALDLEEINNQSGRLEVIKSEINQTLLSILNEG